MAAVTRNRIARLNADGTLDTAFNPKANGRIQSPCRRTEKSWRAGVSPTSAGSRATVSRASMQRPELADSFNPNANNTVYAIAVQPDGKILAGGDFREHRRTDRNRIARLDATTGVADSFDPNANSGVAQLRCRRTARFW